MSFNDDFLEYISKNDFLNEEQIQTLLQILEETELSISSIILSEKWKQEDDLARIISDFIGKDIRIIDDDIVVSETLFELIPKAFCKENNVLPFKEEDDSLHIGLSEPYNNKLLEEMQFIAEKELVLYLMPEQKIKNLLTGSINKSYQSQNLGEGRIVQIVSNVIIGALQKNASDIHIESSEKQPVIRYRIDGVLTSISGYNLLKEEHPALISRIKILSGLDISEKRLPQDGRILFKYNDQNQNTKEMDIRVSIIPSIHGESVVLRILDRDSLLVNLNSIGFSKSQFNLILKSIKKSNGMVLASGPTGSGKTTSLYAILSYLNNTEKKILTIEDPVEYQINGVEQIQANASIGFTFAEGLRSFLRHDPDIIMVGEIRDEKTAEIAIRSSLTGHLVLSTIHTNDSASSITRLLDMGIKPYLVASTVSLIISQRLVRKLCDCKKQVKITQKMIISFGMKGLLRVGSKIYEKKGCSKCEKTGYKGREAIFEILSVSATVKEAILKEKSSLEILKIAQKEGLKTLLQAGIEKVKKGITTLEEVFRVAE